MGRQHIAANHSKTGWCVFRGRFFHDGVDRLQALFIRIDADHTITAGFFRRDFFYANDTGAGSIVDIDQLGECALALVTDHVVSQQDGKGLVSDDGFCA